MNITQLFNSNSFSRANNPKFVFLHGTAGGTSALAIAQYFQTAGVSAHYVIGVDGEIYQCNDERDGAYADGVIDGIPTPGLPFRTQSDGIHRDDWWDPNGINPNNEGIAIEHCKPHDDNSDVLTPAQQASSLWLVNDICTRWNIPKRFADSSGGITGHFSVAAESRQRCPGPYPWSELWQYLNGNGEETMSIDITTPGVATYFKASADDKTWQCTNGKLIGGAILDFYKSFGGSGLCGLSWLGLPTSNEIGVTGHPGVVYQRFERAVAVFDPSRSSDNPPGITGQVYLAHIDSGIGQDPQIAQLQSQVTALKTLPASGNLQTINGLVAQASTAIAVAGTAIAKIGPLSQVQ